MTNKCNNNIVNGNEVLLVVVLPRLPCFGFSKLELILIKGSFTPPSFIRSVQKAVYLSYIYTYDIRDFINDYPGGDLNLMRHRSSNCARMEG